MKMQRLGFALGALVAAALVPGALAATGEGTDWRALQREALAGDGAWAVVESLTTEVGNRFAGTPRFARAAEWATRKLRELGYPEVRTEPVTVPRWIRGAARGEILSPWPQRTEIIALGGSEGTPLEGIEAAVVAVEDVDALMELPEGAVRGKIVFFTRRMRRTDDGAGYGETVPIRSKGPAEAGKLGAVAVLIRSVATDVNRIPHTGGTRYAKEGPRIPAAALSVPDAELLERELRSGHEVRYRLFLGCRYEADVEQANVIGELPGRGALAGEIVLIAAHLDSWDVGTGAQDDGAGVAIAIESARLAAARAGDGPRRTIRVLLTVNEEFGLSGARAYAAAHADEVARHAVGFEADSGAGRVLRYLTRFAAGEEVATAELGERLAALAIPAGEGEARGGADLSPLKKLGLPLVDLRQDASLYFDIHHTENDTLDKIDPAHLRQVTAAFATALDWAAGRPQPFPFLAPDPPAEEE